MADIRLSLILPTYNEEENLKVLLPRLAQLFAREAFEVVVVDDGSKDNTVGFAREFCRERGVPFKPVLRQSKQGIGSAIRAGLSAGRGEVLFTMDADCAFPDSDIKVAWAKFNAEHLDILVGQRTSSSYESSSLRTRIKRVFSIAGNWFVSVLVGLPGVNDYSLNFRIIKRELWSRIKDKPYHPRNFFLFQMIDEAHRVTKKIAQIPVRFLDRTRGVSKMSVLKDPFIFFYNFILWRIKH